MLEPDTRYLLLDSLRPPPGYSLDMAVGTSFTLNLQTLMTVPIAFAMFDRQREDGSLIEDAIATLQALRENAGRITLFSQAGHIGVPREYRSLYVHLEDTIYPVIPPKADAIFHPKVWYLRYRESDGNGYVYRLLCLSRNLTFDRSWDTVLRLNGRISDEVRSPELARFTRSLLNMSESTRPLPADRFEAIQELGEEFSRVKWQIPDHFDDVRFWPLGDNGSVESPFPERVGRILIISPFLTQWPIERLTKRTEVEQSIVLSRPESFDLLGGDATGHLSERLVLSSDTSFPDDIDAGDETSAEESIAEAFRGSLDGLHAKVYVMDLPNGRSRVLTGSANATWPAFHENVEFMVELSGSTEQVGVQATIGDQQARLGLRALVEPYEPENEDPGELSTDEHVRLQLDRASRLLGGLRYTAECERESEDAWKLSLNGETTREQELILDGITLNVRPITILMEPVTPGITRHQIAATFTLSEDAITPYFSFTVSHGGTSTDFLVTADLVNPPPDRDAKVLRDLLKNPRDFVRLLLLLLGNIDDALAVLENSGGDRLSEPWFVGPRSEALLEPMVRAFARDPERLREVERLIMDLSRHSEDSSVLPDGWWEVWTPIADALEGEVRT
jgi:hypothetical protein